ncbi:hypothetical protein J4234_00215 [Candidatus Woesearchaeota archaeon]|nr:hypothetical protein [Candidatus Woesearchaeota archaeon]
MEFHTGPIFGPFSCFASFSSFSFFSLVSSAIAVSVVASVVAFSVVVELSFDVSFVAFSSKTANPVIALFKLHDVAMISSAIIEIK